MKARPGSLIAIWVCGFVSGAVLGGLTNAINAQVSPLYFRNIMGWHEVTQISRAIVAQGLFEGMIYGLVMSTIFAIVVGLVSKLTCPFSRGARYLLYIAALAVICWAAGGLLAIALASLSPEFYMRAFRGVPEEAGARLRYAWVGGSIWGIQFGGAAAVLVVAVIFGATWNRTPAKAVEAKEPS